MKITHREQAWDIWKEYAPAVYAYLQRRTKDSSLTDDLTQEVALRVYDACCSNKEIKNVRSWLFQIAYHTLVDFYKDVKRSTLATDCCQQAPLTDVYEELSPFLPPLIEFLPPKYALPLKLSDLEGMKQSDVAAQLELTLTATKSRIQRARKLLKAKINTCFHIKEKSTSGLVCFVLKSSCQSLQQFSEKNNPNLASF